MVSKVCSCKIASLKTDRSRSLDEKVDCDIMRKPLFLFIALLHFETSSIFTSNYSEHFESLSNVTFNSLLLDSEDIISDSLGDWSALTNSDNITNSSSCESWAQMGW